MERSELISLLDVTSDPTTGQVRQARRLLARRVHPDTAGQQSAAAMSEINAAVDEWLIEIRSHSGTTTAAAAPAPTPGPARSTQIKAPVPLRMTDAVATILLVGAIAGVVVALLGFSVMSLATGGLLGSGAAGVFATLVYHRERRSTQRSS